MKSSYLVQRLTKPTGFVNPFSFGGGYRNGGLNDEVMNAFMTFCSFDYMGAAEFEFGALPQSLNRIYENRGEYCKAMSFVNKKEIYIVCRENCKAEIIQRIVDLANGKARTQEPIRFGNDNYIGWLELNNDFAFFTNKETRDAFADLLQVSGRVV